ncbi:MAG: IS66 family transposase zinc-finger binding domain-containing protein [Devosia sp.]
MPSTLADLPDDVDPLKAIVATTRAELALRDFPIEKLKHQLSGLKRHRFSTSAEGLEQLQLTLEDLEITHSGEGSPVPSPAGVPKAKPVHKPLPGHLPRRDAVLSPGTACDRCGGRLKLLGEDVFEELEYAPGRFVVHRARVARKIWQLSGCAGRAAAHGMSVLRGGPSGAAAVAPDRAWPARTWAHRARPHRQVR